MESKLNIGKAISYGVDRLTTRGGAMLLAAYFLLQIVVQVNFQSIAVRMYSDFLSEDQLSEVFPLALELPVAISAGLFVVLMIVGMVLGIVAIRAIYADINSVPTADHTRRLARTIGVFMAAGLIAYIAIGLGSILILPGIFLTVCLIFVPMAVVIEDAGPIEALERSWELTSGNRLRLFALGLIIVVGSGVVGGIFGLLGFFIPIVDIFVFPLLFSIVALFSVAVQVGAYRQLADDGEPADTASW